MYEEVESEEDGMFEPVVGIPRGVFADVGQAVWESHGGSFLMHYYSRTGEAMEMEVKVRPTIIPWDDESKEN